MPTFEESDKESSNLELTFKVVVLLNERAKDIIVDFSDKEIKKSVQYVLERYDMDEVNPQNVYVDVIEHFAGFNLDHKEHFIKSLIRRSLCGEPAPRQLLMLVMNLENDLDTARLLNYYDGVNSPQWISIRQKLNSVREGIKRGSGFWQWYWHNKKNEIYYIIEERIRNLQTCSSNTAHFACQSELTERMIAICENILPGAPNLGQVYMLLIILHFHQDLADNLYVIGGDLNEKWIDAARKLNASEGGIQRTPQYWASYWASKKVVLTLVIDRRIKTGRSLPQSLMDEHFIILLQALRNKRLEKETRRNERLAILERRRNETDPSSGSSSFLPSDPTSEQLLKLVTFLEDNPDVAEEKYVSNEDIIQKWGGISDELNSVRGGLKGTPQHWKKYWSDKKYDLNLILEERILSAQTGSNSRDLPPQQPPLMERLITLLKKIKDQKNEKENKSKLEQLRNQRLERERRRNHKDPSPELSSWTLGDPSPEQLWNLMVFLEANPDVAVGPIKQRKWRALATKLNSVERGLYGDSNFWFKYWEHKREHLNRVIDARIRTEQTGSHSRVQLPRQPMLIERMITFLQRLRSQRVPSPEPSSRPGMLDVSQQTEPISGSLDDIIARLTERVTARRNPSFTLVEDVDF